MNATASSGRVDLISDRELRGLLADVRRRTDEVLLMQDDVNEVRDQLLWPSLLELGLGPSSVNNMGGGFPAMSTPPPSLDRVRAAGIEGRLLTFAGMVRQNVNRYRNAIEATEAALVRVDELLPEEASE